MAVVKFGYMLEHLGILHYSFYVDKAVKICRWRQSAGKAREIGNPQRLHAKHTYGGYEDIVRSAWRHVVNTNA